MGIPTRLHLTIKLGRANLARVTPRRPVKEARHQVWTTGRQGFSQCCPQPLLLVVLLASTMAIREEHYTPHQTLAVIHLCRKTSPSHSSTTTSTQPQCQRYLLGRDGETCRLRFPLPLSCPRPRRLCREGTATNPPKVCISIRAEEAQCSGMHRNLLRTMAAS